MNDNDDKQALAQKKKKKTRLGPDPRTATGVRRLQSSDPNARGEYGHYDEKIDPARTAKYIPKLQKHLKTLPGGEAMAKKGRRLGRLPGRRAEHDLRGPRREKVLPVEAPGRGGAHGRGVGLRWRWLMIAR